MNTGIIGVALAVLLAAQMVWAAEPINTSWRGNLAIKGYDSVAYFTENRAVKGVKAHQLEWRGANWRFASAGNLELFRQSPEKYAPAYGGYCAWAVSNDALAPIDPQQFTVLDGRLFLNYNAAVQKKWLPEKEERIRLADENWPGLVEEW
ncbi:MAG: YHS domain-containing protein [Cellvibrionales bacterium]|nr:YHS domain-containing protein [Cellvibrionales bacterium]